MKNNKGITLIALIITIIVMLILVAVTITIAVNGGLFNYAQEAGVKTNEAKDLEQEYANLGNYEDYGFSTDYEYLIDKYAVKEIHFTIIYGEDEIECSAEKGMTWDDWYQSDYADKIEGISRSDMNVETDEEGTYLYIYSCGISIDADSYDFIDTEIIDGATYILC